MNLLRFFVSMFDVKLGLGGGGGGGGETKFEWNDTLKPYWESVLQRGQGVADQEYNPYSGQRIADLNSTQTAALDATSDFVKNSGSPATKAANGQIQQTLDGQYLTGDSRNPYADASNPWRDMTADVGLNPYADMSTDAGGQYDPAQVDPGQNAYAGENPYFMDKLRQGMDEIGTKYRDFTAPDTAGAYVLNGTFGGGDYQRAVSNNEAALGKNLSQYATGMFSDQYNRSAQLAESGLDRGMGAQEFNANIGNTAFENAAQRGLQGQTLDRNAGLSGWDAYLGRSLQNSQFDKTFGGQMDENAINRGYGAYESERGRQMGALTPGQNEQQLALQRDQALMGVGDVYHTYQQQGLDQGYQNWLEQQNFGKNQTAWLSSLLSGAQGGLPPNQMTSTPNSPFSNFLGTALMGAGMFRA
jgi:hypothetical protein